MNAASTSPSTPWRVMARSRASRMSGWVWVWVWGGGRGRGTSGSQHSWIWHVVLLSLVCLLLSFGADPKGPSLTDGPKGHSLTSESTALGGDPCLEDYPKQPQCVEWGCGRCCFAWRTPHERCCDCVRHCAALPPLRATKQGRYLQSPLAQPNAGNCLLHRTHPSAGTTRATVDVSGVPQKHIFAKDPAAPANLCHPPPHSILLRGALHLMSTSLWHLMAWPSSEQMVMSLSTSLLCSSARKSPRLGADALLVMS
jgi:hypothetical protein